MRNFDPIDITYVLETIDPTVIIIKCFSEASGHLPKHRVTNSTHLYKMRHLGNLVFILAKTHIMHSSTLMSISEA